MPKTADTVNPLLHGIRGLHTNRGVYWELCVPEADPGACWDVSLPVYRKLRRGHSQECTRMTHKKSTSHDQWMTGTLSLPYTHTAQTLTHTHTAQTLTHTHTHICCLPNGQAPPSSTIHSPAAHVATSITVCPSLWPSRAFWNPCRRESLVDRGPWA